MSPEEAKRVRFVLVGPRSPGNVGAAARALKNLGFARLALVTPACDARSDEARRMAVDAADLLDAATLHDELDDALSDAGLVVGTTARSGKHRRPHWPLEQLAPRLAGAAERGEIALVFGREDRGLTDGELDRCTHLAHLPDVSDYRSFNLAQAVLLAAYELRRAAPTSDAQDAPASHAEREAMYAHLEQALQAIGFLKEDPAEVIMRRLRRLLGRAGPTPQEVRVLRGVAHQTLWAARRADLVDDAADDE